MESKTVNSQKVKNGASYIMLFLSGFGLGYSVWKYFMLTENDTNWATIAPLFILSAIVFFKNIISLRKGNQ